MAYESIAMNSFTSQSDAWSLAITIWEVFNLCRERPYSHLSDIEVLQNLENGELKVRFIYV
jgi:hypothetical protein